jgi:hypothetical protein
MENNLTKTSSLILNILIGFTSLNVVSCSSRELKMEESEEVNRESKSNHSHNSSCTHHKEVLCPFCKGSYRHFFPIQCLIKLLFLSATDA